MNCDTCIENTYFQNTTSTNCIPNPETRYYIDVYNGHKTLFPCFPSCLTCDFGGDADIHNCTSCISEYYFDDEEPTNCVDDDLNCAIGCAKCYKNTSDPIYGVLSADKMCRRCSHKMGYYPLEKYSKDQFYVSCYPYNKSPLNYIYDETKKLHTLCYKTCKTCLKVGDNLNHSCSSCETNYIFIDEEPFNCFPKCAHYYYYNKYKQYKCTEADECPLEYPFLIANKSDKADPSRVFKLYENLRKFEAKIAVSAKFNRGLENLMTALLPLIPEGQALYDPEILMDTTEKFMASEIIREKILMSLRDEVPHCIAVEIDEYKSPEEYPEAPNGKARKKLYIRASLITETEGQKKILIGSKGEMIKKIGLLSRKNLEEVTGFEVFLDLWVKTVPGWRKNQTALKRLGYA